MVGASERRIRTVLLLSILCFIAIGSVRVADFSNSVEASVAVTVPPPRGPDSDAVALRALGERVNRHLQEVEAGAELRQVDIDLASHQHILRFSNARATGEIAVSVPSPDAPVERWQVSEPQATPLAAPGARTIAPALDLRVVMIGPEAVARATSAYRADCRPRTLTLVTVDLEPSWYAFCDLAEGRLMGMVSNQTGVFHPVGPGKPAAPVLIATPVQR